jgi:fermentation-respiration switch protein FrsA (DUF1100 family)
VLRRLLLAAAALYVLVAAVAWVFQRRLQYFPDATDPAAPGGVEDLTIESADGTRLRAWHRAGARGTTLLFLHGNAGHRGDRRDWAFLFEELGWGTMLLDYRGYGGSGGSPTERGLYDDAEAASRWLAEHGHASQVYVGESLGCGVAVELARRRPPRALVLHAGAASLADVGQAAYPWLPVRWILKDRYDAAPRLAEVRCPLLSVHGTADALIPIAMGRALFDAAPGPKEWLAIDGAGHNDLPWTGGEAYRTRVHAFLVEATR